MRKKLTDLPASFLDYTDSDIKTVASLGLRANSQLDRDYFNLRLTGLSLLQFLKKEIKPIEDKDIEWYKFQDVKTDALLDIELEGGREETLKQIREIELQTKEERASYLERNLVYFLKTYTYETLFWLDDWNYFWTELSPNLKPTRLDYQIYFSILNPKPPTSTLIGFHDLVSPLYSKALKDIVVPQYLEYLWNTIELREKLIKGEDIPVDNRICDYYSARKYILSKIEKSDLEIKAEDMKFCLEEGIFPKSLRKIFREVEKAQKDATREDK